MITPNLILINCGAQFPNGSGGTARILAYCRGLRQNGAAVRVLCLKPTDPATPDTQKLPARGTYDGTEFEYVCGRRIYHSSRVVRAWCYLKGLCNAVRIVYRNHRQSPVDAIHYYGHQEVFGTLAAWCAARLVGGVFLVEKVEYPFVYRHDSIAVRVKRLLSRAFVDKLPDGLIVISTFLQNYFRPHVRKDCRLLLVPSLVEMDYYPEPTTGPQSQALTVIYCGNLYNDGEVERLMKAFAIATRDLPDWRLEIIGDTSDRHRWNELCQMVGHLKLEGRVQFAGAVERRDIPHRLGRGDIMALPRASGTFSLAGFPTKLAEYLATGHPVVVTRTGDISRYLEDSVNAYLVPPDDVEAFAERLRYVMLHPREASKVGARGRQAALREFDGRTHCLRILNFVSELRGAKTRLPPRALVHSGNGQPRCS